MSLIHVAGLTGGLVLLVIGAEALVRGASRLAVAAGVSPIVVGLTVVAFGTSAPELAVSVGSAVTGAADVAVGNVVGSNIFNVLAILGISALAAGLVVDQRIVRIDVPLVILATVVVWLLALDGRLGRVDGLLLAAGIAVYTVWSYMASRSEPAAVVEEYDEAFGTDVVQARRAWVPAAIAVAGGLVALVVGAQLLVDAATAIARALGVSDLVIGLTVVAAGTSLPELATSGIAALRGERDIAVGNVVGSNLFNLLAVLGVTALVAPEGVSVARDALTGDLPVAFLTMCVALPALASGYVVERWEGGLLLVAYVAYLGVLVLGSIGSTAAAPARAALLVVLGLLAVLLVAVGRRHRSRVLDGQADA